MEVESRIQTMIIIIFLLLLEFLLHFICSAIFFSLLRFFLGIRSLNQADLYIAF